MPIPSEGWFLYPGPAVGRNGMAELVHEHFELSDLEEDEMLVEPIYGSWEANIDHALHRDPVDICRMRGEDKVIPGNGAIVRVVEVGNAVKGFRPGQYGFSNLYLKWDRWGYTELVSGYDWPGHPGLLCKRLKVKSHWLLPVPDGTRHGLAQWAAFSIRYPTAWSNWELAYGTFRLLIGAEEMPSIHVWGWGGGTSLAELDLARRHGHQAVMLSGDPRRRAIIERAGVPAVDRTAFESLEPPTEGSTDAERNAYVEAEEAFLREVQRRTGGEMVQVFVDMIGKPVFRATLKALSRQGVITTAGWKAGMRLSLLRALECIRRRQHVHTHFARRTEVKAAVDYAERTGWMPEVDERIYGFDEIPQLAQDYAEDKVGMFTCYQMNPE